MYLYNSQEIKEWDKFTIESENIESIVLMERAGQYLFDKIIELVPNNDLPIHIFCGMGNNGGDGLVIARLLRNNFYNVTVYECRVSKNETQDFLKMKDQLKEFSNIKYQIIENIADFPEGVKGVIIDAIFGSGLNNELSELALDIVHSINRLEDSLVISIDVPSGLFIDKVGKPICIKAKHTLSIQNMKLAFLFEAAYDCLGEIHLIDIGLSKKFSIKSNNIYLDSKHIKSILPTRKKFSNKGNYGKVLLISGEDSMLGASILAMKSLLKSGVGLSYLACKSEHRNMFNTLIPESILIDKNKYMELENYNSIGIGPGLGINEESISLLNSLLLQSKQMILDADALNIIAKENWLNNVPKNSVLTPHPKEFDRLFGNHNNHYERYLTQIEKSKEFGIFIILKTAHTSISCPNGEVYFNSTGNPGMAKGGSGDVLTGLLIGLDARIMDTKTACMLSVYLHGLAGDIAREKYSMEGFTISQMIDCISYAWKNLEN